MTRTKRLDWLNVGFWTALFGVLFLAGYGARAAFGQPIAQWIVPKATFSEPWLWVEVEPGVHEFAGTEPTLVCLDDAGSFIAEPGTRLRLSDNPCAITCPARTCALCARVNGQCYVRCEWIDPMQPWQWGDGCPSACRINPWDGPTGIDPADMDEDKPDW